MSNVVVEKMDFSGKKMLIFWKMDSFSNTLNRFKKWNFAIVREPSPPDPLRGRVIAFKWPGRPPPKKSCRLLWFSRNIKGFERIAMKVKVNFHSNYEEIIRKIYIGCNRVIYIYIYSHDVGKRGHFICIHKCLEGERWNPHFETWKIAEETGSISQMYRLQEKKQKFQIYLVNCGEKPIFQRDFIKNLSISLKFSIISWFFGKCRKNCKQVYYFFLAWWKIFITYWLSRKLTEIIVYFLQT